jgi:hypothetical protein
VVVVKLVDIVRLEEDDRVCRATDGRMTQLVWCAGSAVDAEIK